MTMLDESRRRFLGSILVAGVAPMVLPARLFGAGAPSNTLRIGSIGTGRMGLGDMGNAMAAGLTHNARVIAVCDVDRERTAVAKTKVDEFDAERNRTDAKVREYQDFRELLARDDIDAVTISTPDHWHAAIAVAAAKAGKHIYLQKPLTYTIPEGRKLVEAVRHHKVVLQVGSQQRSSIYFRQVCTIVRNGWLGELRNIEVKVSTDTGRGDATPMEVPPNLDYDMWLGPAPEASYTEQRVHPQKGFGRPGWLQIERYCRGMITGWGSHMYDIAQWGMGTDRDSGPIEYRASSEFPDRGLFNVHTEYVGEAKYANGVVMSSGSGSPGVKFICENGWAYCSREKMECSDRQLLRRKPNEDEVSLYQSSNHMGDFLQSVRDGSDPVCPVEVGHRSNTICVLHHISMKLGGRSLRWDPEKEAVIGDPEAAAMIEVSSRDPWKI